MAQVRAVWLPLGVILLAYATASAVNEPLRANLRQGAPNLLGFPLHIGEPVVADEWLFGSLPTNWLAQRLHGSAGPQWYDAVAAILFWAGAAGWARLLLLLYPVAMGVTLVYTGEHYVVDVLAGCLAASLVVIGWRLVTRRDPDRTVGP